MLQTCGVFTRRERAFVIEDCVGESTDGKSVVAGEFVVGCRAFRIAHMGHVHAPMVFGVLGAVEMALGALGIPHGRGGLQAAVEYLGREVRH